MTDLLTDLTGATKGSRDLTAAFMRALGFRRAPVTIGVRWKRGSHADGLEESYSDDFNPTVNLQDAVDLVPADIHWQASEDGASVFWSKKEGYCYDHKKPPALALCIALLKYMEKT